MQGASPRDPRAEPTGTPAPSRAPAASLAGCCAESDLGIDSLSPGGPLVRVLLSFAALVVAYDAAASALVAVTGWSYATLALGGLAIQVAAGFVAGRRGGFLWAILAGASTALAEGTLGFAAAWLIGPGRTHLPATLDYLGALALAVLAGAALGGVGGAATLGWSTGAEVGTDAPRGRWDPRAALRALQVDRFLVRALMGRGVGLWLGIEVLYALALGAGGGPLGRMLGVNPGMLVLVALVALADLARRREFVFFADLGVGPVLAVALYVLPGALLDGALSLVLR